MVDIFALNRMLFAFTRIFRVKDQSSAIDTELTAFFRAALCRQKKRAQKRRNCQPQPTHIHHAKALLFPLIAAG